MPAVTSLTQIENYVHMKQVHQQEAFVEIPLKYKYE